MKKAQNFWKLQCHSALLQVSIGASMNETPYFLLEIVSSLFCTMLHVVNMWCTNNLCNVVFFVSLCLVLDKGSTCFARLFWHDDWWSSLINYSCFFFVFSIFMMQVSWFLVLQICWVTIVWYAVSDESPSLKHDGPGLLSMAISDRDALGSHFLITFQADHHLDRFV